MFTCALFEQLSILFAGSGPFLLKAIPPMILPNETLLDALCFLDYVALETAALANSVFSELLLKNAPNLARRRLFRFGGCQVAHCVQPFFVFEEEVGFVKISRLNDEGTGLSSLFNEEVLSLLFNEDTDLALQAASSAIGPHPITTFVFEPDHMTSEQLDEIFARLPLLSKVRYAENQVTLYSDHKAKLDGLLRRLVALEQIRLVVDLDLGFQDLLLLDSIVSVPSVIWTSEATQSGSLSPLPAATEKAFLRHCFNFNGLDIDKAREVHIDGYGMSQRFIGRLLKVSHIPILTSYICSRMGFLRKTNGGYQAKN